jgi:uncharacterized repeat protein (TIGR01451 family)
MAPHKIGALFLCALFACAPAAPALAAELAPQQRASAQQQDDTPSDAEQSTFTRAQRLYNDGRYEQAANAFKDFLKSYPNSIIYDLTLLWLGRSYIALNRIPDAEQVAQQLRGIKDTPFVEIYDGELQSARQSAARAGAAPRTGSEGARPAQQATQQTARAPQPTIAPTPTPPPAARLVNRMSDTRAQQSRSQPRADATPTPRPTPASATTVVAEVRPPSLSSSNPTADGNAGASQSPSPTTRRNGRYGRRAPYRRGVQPAPVNNTQQGTTARQSAAQNTQPAQRPTPMPRAQPTPQRATTPAATATPRRVETARNNPPAVSTTPAPSRSEANSTVTTEPPVTNSSPGGQGGAAFTVRQVPNLALMLRNANVAASPGQSIQIPLVVTNSGNKEDQFRLETDLPAEFQPTFSLAQGGQDTGLPILVTPQLQRGQALDVLLNVRVPETATDGLQRKFIVRAASQADFQINRVQDAALLVVAAALAGSSAVGRDSVQPGETFTQTITVRNRGSSAAKNSRADFVFSPDFELVSADPLPIFYTNDSRTAVWSLGDLDSGSSRDIRVTLRAVADALAANRPVGRGIMRTASLPAASNFDGPSINVGRVPRARIEAVSAGLTATPGDVIYMPFVVRNPGNYAESYDLRITAPGAPNATIYADTNGDGRHQDGEPSVTQTRALEPRGGQFPLLLRVDIPRATPDRQQFAYNVVARAMQSNRAASEATTVLTVAAPRVRVRTEQVTDESAPGDVSFYRLVLVNEGGGLAKNLSVTEMLPAALQVVETSPRLEAQAGTDGSQRIAWRVNELAPGDTAVLLITVRLRADLAAGAAVTTTRSWSYQDANGNTYQNQ